MRDEGGEMASVARVCVPACPLSSLVVGNDISMLIEGCSSPTHRERKKDQGSHSASLLSSILHSRYIILILILFFKTFVSECLVLLKENNFKENILKNTFFLGQCLFLLFFKKMKV